MSNSLDPDKDLHSVGLHLGSNCLQKAIGRRQNSPLACRVITGIVRPANRDWACQTERCHTLSNKTSLQ